MVRKEESSSGTKPWFHHAVAVLAWALATYGCPIAPAAARLSELRIRVRLLSFDIVILPWLRLAAVRLPSAYQQGQRHGINPMSRTTNQIAVVRRFADTVAHKMA